MNKPVMVVGSLAVAAGAVSLALCGFTGFAGGHVRVDAQCLSTFGSLNNGVCLDQPSGGTPGGAAPSGGGTPSGGTPWVGIGPTNNGGGPGISTSPLFPGQTFNVPLGP